MRLVHTTAMAVAGLALLAAVPAQLASASVQKPAGTRGHAAAASSGFKLPYTDPDQVGQLTFCGTSLKPITHGSITASPFVWRVVSSMPTPKGYFIKGAKAQMFAYQPRPYTPAGAWSGTVMAAASYYSNPKHPMAQFTPIDESLDYMIKSFPPIWDHLIELRLYLGAPGLTEFTRPYAAADVQVHGNTWTLVSGGHASCTSGKVESVEVAIGLPGARAKPKPTSSDPAASSPAAPAQDGSGSSTPAGQAKATTVADSQSTSNAAPAIAIGVVALALAVAAGGGIWWRRRRRATG
jgi:hypothetical protein